tara:strand:- start:109 stop:510 length:402 start_codon:yes stop_codon:yes gene_type:complete
MNIHDHLKLSKCGYSKITDHVCREIRHNRINREEGKNLIKFYEQKNVENLKLFSDWLDIDINSLNFILNRSKNSKFWIEKDANKFSFKGISTNFKNSNNEIYKDNLDKEFICTDKIELKQSNRSYVLFGKGIE